MPSGPAVAAARHCGFPRARCPTSEPSRPPAASSPSRSMGTTDAVSPSAPALTRWAGPADRTSANRSARSGTANAFGTYAAGDALDPVSAFLPLDAACGAEPVEATAEEVPVAEATAAEAVSTEPEAAPVWPWAVGGIALGTISDPGHPGHVQAVALMTAHALGIYRDRGFRVPPAVTIRLCTHGGEAGANYRGGTEVWLDHVWVSTRLDGPDALLTVAHEVFHRVQYLYNDTAAKTSPLYAALREGGARLAEDWVLDAGDR